MLHAHISKQTTGKCFIIGRIPRTPGIRTNNAWNYFRKEQQSLSRKQKSNEMVKDCTLLYVRALTEKCAWKVSRNGSQDLYLNCFRRVAINISANALAKSRDRVREYAFDSSCWSRLCPSYYLRCNTYPLDLPHPYFTDAFFRLCCALLFVRLVVLELLQAFHASQHMFGEYLTLHCRMTKIGRPSALEETSRSRKCSRNRSRNSRKCSRNRSRNSRNCSQNRSRNRSRNSRKRSWNCSRNRSQNSENRS